MRAEWLVPLAAALWAVTPAQEAAVDIGDRVEMLIDRAVVERLEGAVLRLHPPERREVVLVTDRPCEGPDSAYFTAVQDGSRVRLYYRGHIPNDLSEEQVTCVAESEDGITFTRPNLGLYEFQGSRSNNIVYRGAVAHNFAPFLDTNPAARPEERYKAVGGVESRLFAFVSADGLRWRQVGAGPVLTDGAFDSLNVAFWDQRAGLYRCYSRHWSRGGYSGVRAIQGSTSADFVHWSKPIPNTYAAGVPEEHFYTNATRPCPGAEHVLLSFPKRFVPERTQMEGYTSPGVSDGLFMSSRDGTHWDRTFLEAWVRPGPDPRNWTQRSNMPAAGIVQTNPDEFTMYVSEHYGWPDNRLRRLVIRRHRFGSAYAGAAGGEMVTRPLTFSGNRLLLNYATSAAGSLRVEVQRPNGTPVPGFSLDDYVGPEFGDELDGAARWKGGTVLPALEGQAVRFRFVLRDADLYAFRTARRP